MLAKRFWILEGRRRDVILVWEEREGDENIYSRVMRNSEKNSAEY